MSDHWNTIIEVMAEVHGVQFADGLSGAELHSIEQEFEFSFPPELAEFLQLALPVSDKFPNWRDGSREELQSRLDRPCAGILFDVERNNFWLPEWGDRPDDFDIAKTMVRELVANAPKMIPIYSHRMIPDRPNSIGNPVFSVHQTDIIYYGSDLRDYFIHEFFSNSQIGRWPVPHSIRKIEFWDPERFAAR